MPKLSVTCTSWRALRRNSLCGFASVRIEELRLGINEVAVHETNGKLWAALPSQPWLKDGCIVRDDAGKPKYTPLFQFDSNETRAAFSNAVVDAVKRFSPHALDGNADGARHG